ncbi:uncharacterized protein HMPREF1541_03461 [Cyphellophora europaea CBS 101466]|uniref:Inheritance of peroxisomes protein 1 n=1 Tax=Cyphellophora europaea (strain CBS 101466) TaxID=1220924 RepID=W2RYW8_CYPE1|nr:uncharacterized protein HMPREF1541_03461 [Cyphellophora europaea CBS 101466]ETN41525.1 hypothetical protein HMPREF1541_03461 [Cyphellophora europaea CBS 101466]
MSNQPAYGEEPPLQGFRRSFTVPHRQLSYHERAGLKDSDADSGLLYQHPAVRIFSFAPPSESIVSKSGERHVDADYPIDTIETLPWRSRTEDLIASGPMRIEKIKGSVNFLKCGHNFVHSILRNSQSWCVDGESKFVLRKGRLQYYRIELPNTTADDKAKVEELKAALPTVLKYEKTPCPFKRAFHVDLPDDAITPRRKGKWTRREGEAVTSPDVDSPAPRVWKTSRPPTSYTPPSSFPGSFSKRRASDYVSDTSMPIRPLQLERRRSVAERRAAFEKPQPSSQPPSRPRTPASAVSSEDLGHEDCGDSEAESTAVRATDHGSRTVANQFSDAERTINGTANITPLAPRIAPVVGQQLEQSAEHEPNVASISAPDAQVSAAPNDQAPASSSDPVPTLVNLESTGSRFPTETQGSVVESSDSPQVQSFLEPKVETIAGDLKPVSEALNGDQGSKPNYLLEIPSPEIADDTESVVSTADSFHTVDTIPEHDPVLVDTDPTPMAEHFDPLGTSRFSHKRDISDITVTASSLSGCQDQHDGDQPGTPNLVQSTASDDSWSDVQTPSAHIQDGLRQRLHSRRSLSPLPPSSIVVTPPPPQPSSQVVTAIIQKAASIAVVKPIEMVALVVHVLSRIAGGATLNDLLSGGLFQRPQQPRRHARNPSFPDHIARDDDTEEDDFGVPIRGRTRSPVSAAAKPKVATIKEKERDTDVDSLFADDLD